MALNARFARRATMKGSRWIQQKQELRDVTGHITLIGSDEKQRYQGSDLYNHKVAKHSTYQSQQK